MYVYIYIYMYTYVNIHGMQCIAIHTNSNTLHAMNVSYLDNGAFICTYIHV